MDHTCACNDLTSFEYHSGKQLYTKRLTGEPGTSKLD